MYGCPITLCTLVTHRYLQPKVVLCSPYKWERQPVCLLPGGVLVRVARDCEPLCLHNPLQVTCVLFFVLPQTGAKCKKNVATRPTSS